MMDELKTLGTFGLKTKKELWKTQTELSRVRLQARSLLALRQEEREEKRTYTNTIAFKNWISRSKFNFR